MQRVLQGAILVLVLLYGGVAQSAPIATVPVSPTPLVTVTAATPDKLPGWTLI
jgi:hypothetical protein